MIQYTYLNGFENKMITEHYIYARTIYIIHLYSYAMILCHAPCNVCALLWYCTINFSYQFQVYQIYNTLLICLLLYDIYFLSKSGASEFVPYLHLVEQFVLFNVFNLHIITFLVPYSYVRYNFSAKRCSVRHYSLL